ncbi:MAG: hypothetical protein N3G22_01660 [Candidatus Micrarchaeota archaeon]|nr:hypothetical protein [Candidatus Micrarchaeota archaeon]
MKTSVLLVIMVLLAIAIGWLVFSKPPYPMTEEDARKFFLEDLSQRYPNADVREIIEIVPMVGSDGLSYYQLKARVTENIDSPCPERIHVYYDYPPKNFVAQPPEYITKGCRVCLNVDVCVIAYPEEAIIASHTYPGAEKLASFLKKYSDAKATVEYKENYGGYVGVWIVKWRSDSLKKSWDRYLVDGGQRPTDWYEWVVLLSKSENKVLEVKESTSAEPAPKG